MNVLKRGYDTYNSMCNPTETILTPTAVAEKGIRKIFSLPFEGDARGSEGQPLVVHGLVFPDGRTHDVVYHATCANQLWAHDLQTSQQLWMVLLRQSVKSTKATDMYEIADHIGVLSTPVIDADTNTLYCVTWGSDDQLEGDATFMVHAVDLITGQPKQKPLSLEGATYTSPSGVVLTFKSVVRKQRGSLILHVDEDGVKTIMIPAGSLVESADTNKGWLLAIDVASWSVAAAWPTTATGSGGGLWNSGASSVVASDGTILVLTGNGDFNPELGDYGQALVQLRYSPPYGTAEYTMTETDLVPSSGPASFEVIGCFAPWTDAQRTGSAPDADKRRTPSNARPLHRALRAGTLLQGMASGDWSDQDLGSSGVLLVTIADVEYALFSCKDGILYCIKVADIATKSTTLASAGTAENYAALALEPQWFTFFRPSTAAPVGEVQIQQILNVVYGNATHHLHGEMAFFESAIHGPMVFVWGENGNLRAWKLTATGIEYLGCSAEMASPDCVGTPGGGMPGGMISVSCDADGNNGIVWASVPYGDANQVVTPGRLLAYDAQSFGTYSDGSGAMKKLWDSQEWAIAYDHNKFSRITVSDGYVVVPTYDGRTDVYALA